MARKSIYFDSQCGLASYAIAEEGKLKECAFEAEDNGNIVGNIYKGKVTNVLNGMQAAFINCGLEKNCYISVDGLCPDRSKYDGAEIDIPSTLNLNVGDEIMVQIVKPPVGKKGAKVTTNLSFVGKYTVYLPNTPFVGVSRKISDPELRKNLMFSAEREKKGNEGIIVRTAAPYAVRRDKLEEVNYYRKLYATVKSKFRTAAVGELLYSDSPLHMRVLRDNMVFDVEKIHVGTKALQESVSTILKLASPRNKIPVVLHDEGLDMYRTLGLHRQFLEMMQPKVELENGAYLVIEPTEALTVIDVNTGKFIGDDSLEHTVYYTNILAAREIARQVRLRNIGGIIVVDFIDMDDANHRKSLVEELEKALESDKAKCHVLPMSKFGLVEFTRKRIGPSTLSLMTKDCRYCRGAGYTRTHEFILFDLRAKLLELLSQGNHTVCIDMNFDLANKLVCWTEMVANVRALYPQARVYVTSHRTYHEETVTFRVENSPTVTLPEGTVLLY